MKKTFLHCCELLGEALRAVATDDPDTAAAVAALGKLESKWDVVRRRPSFKKWVAASPIWWENYAECECLIFTNGHRLELVGAGFWEWRAVGGVDGLREALDLVLEFVTKAQKKPGRKAQSAKRPGSKLSDLNSKPQR
jgi:hypothetical protein